MKDLKSSSPLAAASDPASAGQTPVSNKFDGAAYYTANCASCHGQLNVSTKKYKTALDISNAVRSQPLMSQFQILTNSEIQAIADALSGGAPVPTPVATPLPTPAPATSPPTPSPIPNATPAQNTFFGESRCAGSKFLFCDDFEASEISSARWGIMLIVPDKAQIALSTAKSARGRQSVHITNTNGNRSYLMQSGIFPTANNIVYTRVFVYFEALPTGNSHWSFMYAGADPYSGQQLRFDGWNPDASGKIPFFVGPANGQSGEWGMNSQNPPPMKQWLCLETMVDSQNNEVRVWYNDIEQTEMHITSQTPPTQSGGKPLSLDPTRFWMIGYNDFWVDDAHPEQHQADLYVDEIAMDTARIGCTR